MQDVNISLFQWLGAGHAPDAQFLWLATQLADGTSWLCLALLAVAAWRQPAQRGYLMATLAAAGAAALAAHALAQALNLPRPFVAGLSPNYIAHGARGSLPSAHASVMFTLALVLCLRPALRTLGLAVFAIALVTGWARIYVGAHFPFDIAAGLALAIVITGLFWVLAIGVRRIVLPLIARDDARSAKPTGTPAA
ncbi:phosphatase PAP2 family protein [Variovorax sp. J31P179]|uniref:phosphatase PAP2 family protein n=1 Tax=Variovorax sp. J31P179 TaxID=3053508 RepID=UPI0025790E73|nr:phosphatase PAP2 family protein [Variovorax sp. J31P179]MDM0080440.1 phosphatase PAP2 family protein [Variovorax sp. J31P179]